MSRNEADIAECSIHHMLAEGVDLILVADQSTDGTREILESFGKRVVVYPIQDTVNRQVDVINWLVETARACGADWVIPGDIDEFYYSPDGLTLAESLSRCPHDKVYVRRWLHNDWDCRRCDSEPLPKVAFRPLDGVTVEVGAHGCSLPGGVWWLESREIQYRGFEHFKRKAADRIARFDPIHLSAGGGWHHERLRGMDEDALRVEFDALLALPSVFDPIPSRTEFRPKENG